METGNIHQKMVAILADLEAIPKAYHRPASGEQGVPYAFRGIDDVVIALKPLLAKHGVYIQPKVLSLKQRFTTRTNKQGNEVEWERATVRMRYRFVAAEDGSYADVIMHGEGTDNSDKAVNKSFSAAFKYALLQAFAIPTADMEDADSTKEEQVSYRQQSQNVQPAKQQQRASNGKPQERQERSPISLEPADAEQLKRFWSAMSRFGITNEQVHRAFGIESTKETPWFALLHVMNAIPKILKPVRQGEKPDSTQVGAALFKAISTMDADLWEASKGKDGEPAVEEAPQQDIADDPVADDMQEVWE